MRRAILTALLLSAALAAPARADDPQRQITVTGEGMVAAVPDMAWISIGVSHEALKAGDAMAAMSAATATVLAELRSAGISETDIQTGQLTLEPRYDYSSYDGVPKMTGFVASTTLEVRVRALDTLGGVLDAVVNEGANRLSGIRFDVADKDALLDAARRDAVADARARAELYADAGGFTLGALLMLGESGGYAPPMPMYDMRGGPEMAMSVPVAAGEVNFQAMVTMTYAIE